MPLPTPPLRLAMLSSASSFESSATSLANFAAFLSGINSGCGYPLVTAAMISLSRSRWKVGYGARIAKSFHCSTSDSGGPYSAYRFFLLRWMEKYDLYLLLQAAIKDYLLQCPRCSVHVTESGKVGLLLFFLSWSIKIVCISNIFITSWSDDYKRALHYSLFFAPQWYIQVFTIADLAPVRSLKSERLRLYYAETTMRNLLLFHYGLSEWTKL